MTTHEKVWNTVGVYCTCLRWSMLALPNRAGEQAARLGFQAHVSEVQA